MAEEKHIAGWAIGKIAEIWQLDPDRTEWVGDLSPERLREGYGFDWWPGDFKVQVRVHGPHPDVEEPVYRLSVRTDFLRGADTDSESAQTALALLNRFATGFALCALPPEMKHRFADLQKHSDVWLASTAYVHSGVVGWLPTFVAAQAILQPIYSQARAASDLKLLGGSANCSGPHSLSVADSLDDMLTVEQAVYAPAGQEPSRWSGSNEFNDIVEKWGQCDTGFGFGDGEGLTLETPFGGDSAILQLITDQPHPRLGYGLLSILKLPHFIPPQEAAEFALNLNYLEAISWTRRMPLMGNWSIVDNLSGELACPAFSMFVPNFLHQRGLAENIVLWGINRARWVRETFWPALEDLSMIEVLERRHREIAHARQTCN